MARFFKIIAIVIQAQNATIAKNFFWGRRRSGQIKEWSFRYQRKFKCNFWSLNIRKGAFFRRKTNFEEEHFPLVIDLFLSICDELWESLVSSSVVDYFWFFGPFERFFFIWMHRCRFVGNAVMSFGLSILATRQIVSMICCFFFSFIGILWGIGFHEWNFFVYCFHDFCFFFFKKKGINTFIKYSIL